MKDRSIIFRRLLLLLKLIYKPLVLLSGYGLFASMIADANRIYADIPGLKHAYQAILWCVRNTKSISLRKSLSAGELGGIAITIEYFEYKYKYSHNIYIRINPAGK